MEPAVHCNINPIKPAASSLIHTFLNPLNYHYDQTIAEKPVVRNILHVF